MNVNVGAAPAAAGRAGMVGAAWPLLGWACHWTNRVHHRMSRPKSKRTARSVPWRGGTIGSSS